MADGSGASAGRGSAMIAIAILAVGLMFSLPWLGIGYCLWSGNPSCPAFLSPQATQSLPSTDDARPLATRRSADAKPEPTAIISNRNALPPAAPGVGTNPKYVAIVIGNSGYAPPNALANPSNDASDVAVSLQKLGYTLVIDDDKGTPAWQDLGLERMEAAFRQFARRAADAEVAVVFYAGHGMEEGGVNYLIPVDAKLDRDVDLTTEAYAFDNLTRLLPRYGISIVIIDACRTPRFRLADRKGNGRAVEGQRGFQVVEAPDRALFAFSAGPNQRASDGLPGERNSPYTRELVRAMAEPDVKIEDVFKSVRQTFIDRRVEQKPEFRDNLGRPNLAFQPPEPPKKPGTEFRDCPDCPLMVVVPKGKFLMGSPKGAEGSADKERPQHEVTIKADFAVGKFEVTFAEWDACVKAGGCTRKPRDFGRGRGQMPVVDVSWFDTQDYLKWLSARTRKKYRLLSEAEWEYAARAGTQTEYPWGDRPSHEYANYGKDQCCGGQTSGRDEWGEASAPVGEFPANRFGLHDMHGNVWEWVEDCWNDVYINAPSEGRAWVTGDCSRRVLRGGSWDEDPLRLRSAARNGRNPANKSSDGGGFRVARTQ